MAYNGKRSKRIEAWVAANPEKVDQYYTECDGFEHNLGDWSHWIELSYGWVNEAHGVHMVHEPTVKDAMRELDNFIEPCKCEECLAGLEGKDKREGALEQWIGSQRASRVVSSNGV